MLSELYGCTGWQFTFGEYKATGDWQAAMGVNLRCPHLSWYTARGEAKRDYPASISFQSPWWREFALVEDYFSRVNVLLTRGEPVRDVVVIHPIESAWGLFTGSDAPALRELNGKLERLEDALLESHYDFDYADEEFMSRKGRVEGTELAVGLARYRVAVVPPMVTIRGSTLELLGKFESAGGKVIWMSPVASRVDGKPSGGAGKAAALGSPDEVVKALGSGGEGLVRRASIRGADGAESRHALYMMRVEDDGRAIVFICNRSQKEALDPLEVSLPYAGRALEYDPVDGKVYAAEASAGEGGTVIRTSLPAYGSRLFVIEPGAGGVPAPRPSFREARREELRAGKWPVRLDEPNAFPLDMPEVAVEGAEKGRMEVLRADQVVRDAAGLRHRGGAMVQPWADTTPEAGKRTAVRLRYRFRVEKAPKGDCHLVIEDPASFSARLNGRKLVTSRDAGWWMDPSFRKVRVPASALKKGGNELVLETAYGPKSGLECLYFTGEFGVRMEGREAVITGLPPVLEPGDWRKQGLPFYSGGVSYAMEVTGPAAGERAFLEFPGWQGVLVKVRANGRDAGRVAWPPYEVDITGVLKPGRNRVEVKVVSSRRNLMGPLHHGVVYPSWTGPWEYLDRSHWSEDYVGVPYGLEAAPAVSYRKRG
jgi:hypothetical protein